jgi:hypothetical protein
MAKKVARLTTSMPETRNDELCVAPTEEVAPLVLLFPPFPLLLLLLLLPLPPELVLVLLLEEFAADDEVDEAPAFALILSWTKLKAAWLYFCSKSLLAPAFSPSKHRISHVFVPSPSPFQNNNIGIRLRQDLHSYSSNAHSNRHRAHKTDPPHHNNSG